MTNALLMVVLIVVFVVVTVCDYYSQPLCHWCQWRHRGRCIYNPRAGRFFANVNDGYFDYDDPNQ